MSSFGGNKASQFARSALTGCLAAVALGAAPPTSPPPIDRRDLEIVDFMLRMQFPADPAELPEELRMLGEFYRAMPPGAAPLDPRPLPPRDHYDCIERRSSDLSACDRSYGDAIAECDRIHAIEEEKIVNWYRFRIEQNRGMRESTWKRNDQADYERWWKIKLTENNKRRDAGYQQAAEQREQCYESAYERYHGCVNSLPAPTTRRRP